MPATRILEVSHWDRQYRDGPGYLRTLERVTRPGALGLVLMGNAEDPEEEAGPPVVREHEIYEEFGPSFEVLRLRAFRFEPAPEDGRRYLGWSCLLRHRRTG